MVLASFSATDFRGLRCVILTLAIQEVGIVTRQLRLVLVVPCIPARSNIRLARGLELVQVWQLVFQAFHAMHTLLA